MTLAEDREDYVNDWLDLNRFEFDCDARMVWTDIETTGLDENKNLMLEMAFVITDERGKVVDFFESLVIEDKNYYAEYAEANDTVKNMHKKSDLWLAAFDGPRMWSVEAGGEDLDDFLMSNLGGKDKYPLAGSSVHFDRKWLTKFYPKTMARHFTHRNIDISSIEEIVKLHRPELLEKMRGLDTRKYHRALPDIVDTIKMYKFWLDNFLAVK